MIPIKQRGTPKNRPEAIYIKGTLLNSQIKAEGTYRNRVLIKQGPYISCPVFVYPANILTKPPLTEIYYNRQNHYLVFKTTS